MGGVIRGGSMPDISSGWGAVARRTLLSRPRSPLRRSSPRCPRPRPSTGPIHHGAARMRMPLRACACARPRSDPRARIGEHARIPTHLFFPPLPRASPPSPRPPHRPRCPPWDGPWPSPAAAASPCTAWLAPHRWASAQAGRWPGAATAAHCPAAAGAQARVAPRCTAAPPLHRRCPTPPPDAAMFYDACEHVYI